MTQDRPHGIAGEVLATGGTGYIGSHTVIELINQGYEVEILDNLYNSKIEVLDKIEKISGKRPAFYQVDLLDYEKVEKVFQENDFAFSKHIHIFAVPKRVWTDLTACNHFKKCQRNLLHIMKFKGGNIKCQVKCLLFSLKSDNIK